MNQAIFRTVIVANGVEFIVNYPAGQLAAEEGLIEQMRSRDFRGLWTSARTQHKQGDSWIDLTVYVSDIEDAPEVNWLAELWPYAALAFVVALAIFAKLAS